MAKKRKIIAIGAIALVITLMGTLTYAFFVVNVGETKNETVQLTAGTMALTFSDNSDEINEALMFGESVTKDFKIENKGTRSSVAKISFDDLVNTYLAESLTYTLSYATSETGEYKVVKTGNVPRSETASTVELANNLEVPKELTYYYRLTITLENLEDIDQTADTSARLSTRFIMEEGRSTYAVNVSGLKLNVNKTTPNFAETATTDEGVYAMADNYGTSYYFRGAVENNYVKFGKWPEDTPDIYYGYNSSGYVFTHSTLEECQSDATYNQNCTLNSRAGKDMYWRIIRINGDGSVRIVYDGTKAYANGESNADRLALTSIQWNTNHRDAKYVGYMYGGANGEASTAKTEADCAGQEDCVAAQKNETSSNIKTKLEDWYKTNIEDAGYGEYVADVIFCNDRSTADTPNTWATTDTTLGYGTNTTVYMASSRVGYHTSSPRPTFVCPTNSAVNSNNDWFTRNATDFNKGNGDLDYPVGMITADEVSAAGLKTIVTTNQNYLYTGRASWTLSPTYNAPSAMILIKATMNIGDAGVHDTRIGVQPVINLTPEYAKTMLGTGTLLDPYRTE